MTAVKQCNRLFFHDTFWNIWGFKQLFDLNYFLLSLIVLWTNNFK